MSIKKHYEIEEITIKTVAEIEKCHNKQCFREADFYIRFDFSNNPTKLCQRCHDILTQKLKVVDRRYKQTKLEV